MFRDSGLMRTNYLLERGLDTESVRRKVIANNIANAEVPHFKRSEVNFESEIKRVIAGNSNPDNKLPALMEHQKHIPFYTERDIRSVDPRINFDYNTTALNDGNNVDIEKEMVDAAQNLMRYNAFTAGLNHNFRMLKAAMRSA
ncbi:MAG: flagellar basal body rod protein FlgB [Spirochaetia bacterium]|jgi:flagellar basal-body rod protein FlgB|nr:flagellar basal body rod protein FlgB [Spirochaetia bacterium]